MNKDFTSFTKLDGFEYFQSNSINRLRTLFFKFYESKEINLSIKNSGKIRPLFFDFFQTKDFKKGN